MRIAQQHDSKLFNNQSTQIYFVQRTRACGEAALKLLREVEEVSIRDDTNELLIFRQQLIPRPYSIEY